MRATEFQEMDEARKQQERDRLHDIVFETAPNWASWAAMDQDKNWYFYRDKPRVFIPGLCWNHTSVATPDKTVCALIIQFHETNLGWQETLIERKPKGGSD